MSAKKKEKSAHTKCNLFHDIFQQMYKLKHKNQARSFLYHAAKSLRSLHMAVSQHVPVSVVWSQLSSVIV